MRLTFAATRVRWLLAAVVVLVILLGAGFLFFGSQISAAPAQPIAFNHQAMVQVGISCIFCHKDAMRSPSAGIPSVAKCIGCHKIIATNVPVIQQVAAYWTRQEPIPWVRVNHLPRFVYFSHRVHVVAAGLNCERCHGDVGHMTVAVPVVTMNMGWCLSCHEQQAHARQLQDCVVCHQ
jgi:Cytochrome c7 and related cytochrome c